MFLRLLGALFLAVALFTVYLFGAQRWSYSSGERAGWVQKLSKKGWLCKTWEGELALVSMPGSAQEKFLFTIHDEAVAAKVTTAMGKRVALHYEEKVGLPTTCFGDTRHFVTQVTLSEEIPLAPGVVVPTAAGVAAQAQAQAQAASAAAALPASAADLPPAAMAPPPSPMPVPAAAPAASR